MSRARSNKVNKRKVKVGPKLLPLFFRGLKKASYMIFFLASISALSYYGFIAVNNFSNKPIATILQNSELVYLDKKELNVILSSFEGKSFVKEQLVSIQNKMLQNPWVDEVKLTRQWPDTLLVELKEQKPIARWGEQGFINNKGDIIKTSAMGRLSHLPTLYGEVDDAHELMRQYRLLSSLFKEQQLSVVRLGKDKLGRWQLILDNQWQLILGRDQIVEKARRIIVALDTEVLLKSDAIERIDMRYENGFALQWVPDFVSAISLEAEEKI